ncbi:MAG: PKD domain-containing protein [Flavobacteriales bacterium]|nr:PKD domain-containing protein [Flavobacteriales bacterium]
MKRNFTKLCFTLLLGFIGWFSSNAACTAADSILVSGSTVTFQDLGSGNYYGVLIYWGDGSNNTISPGTSTTHTYSSNGSYHITYLNLDSATYFCDSSGVNVTIGSGGGGNPQTCNGTMSMYEDSSTVGLVYFGMYNIPSNSQVGWDFGDGSSGTGQFTSHQYTNYSGAYGVYAYVYELDSSGSIIDTCVYYDTLVASSSNPCAGLIADAGASQTITLGTSTTIGGNPTASGGVAPYTYSWSNGSNVANPTVTPNASMSYFVTVTDNQGCQVVDGVYIGVTSSSNCNASISIQPDTVAANSYIISASNLPASVNSISWDLGDGSWKNGNPVYHTYANSNYYLITLYIIHNNYADTCIAYDTLGGGVNPCASLVADAGSNQYISPGASTQIGGNPSANGGQAPYSYAWNNGSSVANPIVSPSNSTSYGLTVTDANGCQDVDWVVVYVNQPSNCNGTMNFVQDTANPGQVTFTMLNIPGNSQVYWSFGDGNGGQGNPVTHTYSNFSGAYGVYAYVDVFDSLGNLIDSCNYYDTLVAGGTNPCAGVLAIDSVINPSSPNSNDGHASAYMVGGTAPFSYSWSNGSTASWLSGLGVGTYCVTITDANGCSASTCMTLTSQGSGNCQASFYAIQDSINPNTFIFVSTSTPQSASHFWNFGDGNSGTGNPVSHTYNAGGSTFGVTLTILDSANGCQASAFDTVQITVLNPLVVWPGDANADGVADIVDILPIGIGYGTTGPVRPNASLSWTGQPATDFNQTFVNGVNYKHADCNGDGTIDQADLSAVLLNYGLIHNKGDQSLPATMTDPSLAFDMSGVTAAVGATVLIPVTLGDAAISVNDVYGLTFEINYDQDLVEAGSVTFTATNSWLGTVGQDLIVTEMDHASISRLDVGFVRTNQQNISGQGVIGTLSLKIKDDVSNAADMNLDLSFANVNMIDVAQVQYPVNQTNGTVTVSGTSSVSSIDLATELNMYPNPASDILNVELPNAQVGKVTIIDAIGKVVRAQNFNTDRFSIETSEFEKGYYFLQIESNGHQATKRFAVIK